MQVNQISFSALSTALAGSGWSGSGTNAFAIPERRGFFVDPVLVVKEGLSDLDSDFILVSARGAAGKSSSATELASKLQAPLWLLERDTAVGSAALPLNLNSYLGVVDALADISALPSRPTLLIDSLDEARSRVSAQSWDEFLDSVSHAASRGLRIVLFGRERTLEEVWLKLADAGRTIAWLEVSHFPTASQKDYIDGRVVDRDPDISIGGTHYEAARDALLEALAGSVDDDSAETFVGYAPVLDAVATVLLDQQNHYKLALEFASKADGSRHIEVLREILHGLLKRDQGKAEPLANELGLEPHSTYSPDEQIEWLWHDIAGIPEPRLLHISDAAKAFEYKQKIRSFLNDHPFRSERGWASVVFEAYAAAQWLERSLPSKVLLDVGNSSGLLFDFVSSAAHDLNLILDEWQFAALHSSILAGESAGSAATVSAFESADVGLEGRMEVTRPSGPLDLGFTLLPGDSASLLLVGPLEALTLSAPGGVRISPLDGGRVIGPDLHIYCEWLQIDGSEARFARTSSASDEAGEVRFEVSGTPLVLPGFISTEPTAGSFELAIPEDSQVAYPWTNYRTKLEVEDSIDARAKSVRFLKKLQNLARAHGHDDGRATFFMKLQGRQPLKAGKLREVLALLESRGAVRLEGDLVFLTGEADQHRFTGKGTPGQRTIEDEWDYWGPIVQAIESILSPT